MKKRIDMTVPNDRQIRVEHSVLKRLKYLSIEKDVTIGDAIKILLDFYDENKNILAEG